MSFHPFALLLATSVACSDYELAKPDARDERESDTAIPEEDTDRWPPPDTARDTAPPPDTAPEPDPDTCYEPEDGYTANEAARLRVTDNTTPTLVTLVSSSTSYQDELWLDAPESVLLAQAWVDAPGTTRSIGPYTHGTELVFGAHVTNTGERWQSGPASRNADGVVHVAVTYEGGCSWLIGFEDLAGGGDRDFNDVVLRVSGMLRQDD